MAYIYLGVVGGVGRLEHVALGSRGDHRTLRVSMHRRGGGGGGEHISWGNSLHPDQGFVPFLVWPPLVGTEPLRLGGTCQEDLNTYLRRYDEVGVGFLGVLQRIRGTRAGSVWCRTSDGLRVSSWFVQSGVLFHFGHATPVGPTSSLPSSWDYSGFSICTGHLFQQPLTSALITTDSTLRIRTGSPWQGSDPP